MNTARFGLSLFAFDELVFVFGMLRTSARSGLKRYSKQWKYNLD